MIYYEMCKIFSEGFVARDNSNWFYLYMAF